MKATSAGALALILSTLSVPAAAATIVFSGTRANVDAAGPAAARCGARATTNVVNNPPTATSTGLSNFGAFTPTLSHCIQLPLPTSGPTPFDLGQFLFEFASGDTLFGSYSGSLTPSAPGVFAVTQTHLVTGGTGFFLGASGSFDSAGTLSFLSGRATVQQAFSGMLNVSGVPEPATWAMTILGFGAVGAALRRRRQATLAVA